VKLGDPGFAGENRYPYLRESLDYESVLVTTPTYDFVLYKVHRRRLYPLSFLSYEGYRSTVSSRITPPKIVFGEVQSQRCEARLLL
jgi:hypothetical protein